MREGKIIESRVRKRTFEGNSNPEANSDPRTSKYYPSHRYIAEFSVQWSHGGTSRMSRTYRTKQEAEADMAR